MYVYSQTTGHLLRDGALVDVGYSGHGQGLNCPGMQSVPKTGPLPAGRYSIGAAETHPHLGVLAMPLTPGGDTVTFGRSGFFIHGDNCARNQTASEGCIILARITREEMAASGDRILLVTY